MTQPSTIVQELQDRFADAGLLEQPVCDEIPTLWVGAQHAGEVLRHLKSELQQPYPMLEPC